MVLLNRLKAPLPTLPRCPSCLPHPLPRPRLLCVPPLQIGHAGDGGLYAELVQDRSFDALAAATGFHASPEPLLPLDLPALAAAHRRPTEPLHTPSGVGHPEGGRSYSSKAEFLRARQEQADYDPRWVGQADAQREVPVWLAR